MASDNMSLVLHGVEDLRLEEKPRPSQPGKNEVLVAVHTVGICGSDIHYWLQGRIGDFIVKKPLVLGHETSGTILEVGEDVTNLKPGDRVAMEVGIPCRICNYCKTGNYNLCLDMKFAATPPVDGTLTRYYVTDADFCYKLPDHVTFAEGALLEPLSVAVQGCKRGRLTFGEDVLILGAGPVGLLCMLTAKAFGAASVCMTDINFKRLEFAKKIGCDYTVMIDSTNENEMIKRVEKAFGKKPDLVLECSGAESSIRLGLQTCKSGGRIVLIGMGSEEVKVPLLSAAIRQVDIIGSFRYCNCYPTALQLVSTGKIDVKPLITHSFALEQAKEAFEVARTGKENAIKVIIECGTRTS